MELSCAFPPSRAAVEHIVQAEKLGYSKAWLYDSPAIYPDVWMTLACAARETKRIVLGPAVLIPSLRHVLVTASAIATLADLSDGRAALAIGTGFTGRHMLGQRALSWAEVTSYTDALRRLLHGEQVEIDGALIQMSHPAGYAPPRPIAVPIVVAANKAKGISAARALGDGIMLTPASGEVPKGFAWCSQLTFGTVLDPGESVTSDRAFATLGPAIATFYHALYENNPAAVDVLPNGAAWRAAIEKIPAAVRHLQLHAEHLVSINALDRDYVARELGSIALTGTTDEIRSKVDVLAQAGVTELLFAPHGPNIPDELARMRRAVA